MSDDERWMAQEPPDDFADRVMDAIEREERGTVRAPARRDPAKRRKFALFAAAASSVALAAGVVLFVQMNKETKGDRRVAARTEINLTRRVTAVMEPGSHLAWSGNDATQDSGDIFYRVDRGGPLVVHTPAGDVTVHGTCFRIQTNGQTDGADAMNVRDLKAAAVGAAITALATVTVYEGKVSLSHAGQSRDVTLTAGQSAKMDGSGVHGDGTNDQTNTGASATSGSDEPYEEANKNLAASVHEYQTKLAAITADKADVEARLQQAQSKLTAANGGAPPKDEYDLSQDDWKELAKRGTVKYRIPCNDSGWAPSAAKLDTLGLSPEDGKALASAVKTSNDRTWGVIQPLCAQVLGANAEVAAKLGPDVCMSMLENSAHNSKESEGATRAVAEIRAGMRPMPGPNDNVPPLERALLAMTAEPELYEGDLAKSLGPEEAHRLMSADTGCMSRNSFGASDDVMK